MKDIWPIKKSMHLSPEVLLQNKWGKKTEETG